MPPLAIAAGIGAAATIGGAVLSNRATNRASRRAQETSQQATDAANQLTRETYGQNAARLDPIYQSGRRASNALEGLLGIGDPSAPTGYGASALPGAGGYGGGGALGPAPSVNNPADMPDMRAGLQPRDAWASGALQAMGLGGGGVAQLQAALGRLTPQQQRVWQNYTTSNPDPDTVYEQRQAAYRAAHPNETAAANVPRGATPGTAARPAIDPLTGQPMTSSGNAAFDQFRGSTDYQWRFNEGQHALEMSRLPGGGYDSGYTRKALVNYGGHEAAQEIGTYMDRLTGIMTGGNQAASALAGVSTNATNTVNAANMGNATNAANAALANGTNQGAMYGSIAGAIGQAATSAFGGQNSGMYGSTPPIYYTGSDRSYTRG